MTHYTHERELNEEARKAVKLIRFRSDELARVTERAHECGTPVAKYIREAALGTPPRAKRSQANAELIQHLSRIGNNLNQMARVANESNALPESGEIQAVLDELLATIRQVA